MVDVEDGKACDDEHDKECNDLEGDLALLFRRQHAIDLFLTWQVLLCLRHRLRQYGRRFSQRLLLGWLLRDRRQGSRFRDRRRNYRYHWYLIIIDIGHFDGRVVVSIVDVLIVSLAMVVFRSRLNGDFVIRQIEAKI